MPTQPSLNLIPTIQQAITALLTTYEPEFLRFGYSLFIAFATMMIGRGQEAIDAAGRVPTLLPA